MLLYPLRHFGQPPKTYQALRMAELWNAQGIGPFEGAFRIQDISLSLRNCMVPRSVYYMTKYEVNKATEQAGSKDGVTAALIDSAETKAKGMSGSAIDQATGALGDLGGSEVGALGKSIADQQANEKIGNTADSARARLVVGSEAKDAVSGEVSTKQASPLDRL